MAAPPSDLAGLALVRIMENACRAGHHVVFLDSSVPLLRAVAASSLDHALTRNVRALLRDLVRRANATVLATDPPPARPLAEVPPFLLTLPGRLGVRLHHRWVDHIGRAPEPCPPRGPWPQADDGGSDVPAWCLPVGSPSHMRLEEPPWLSTLLLDLDAEETAGVPTKNRPKVVTHGGGHGR